MELVEFRPAISRNARARNLRSPEVVARELIMFAAAAGVSAFTYIGKLPMVVKPDDDPKRVASRHERELRKIARWIERRSGSDRRMTDREDGSERRKSVA